MMQQRDLFLNKIGGGNAENAFAKYMAGGKELSPYNEEQMKILLSKDFDKMNPKEIEEAIQPTVIVEDHLIPIYNFKAN